MPARLENQRPFAPGRAQRPNSRKDTRGYDVSPHTPWGQAAVAADTPSNAATAGTPGTWGPASSTPPTSPANVLTGTPRAITPTPGTAWTTGQYMQTGTAGVGGRVYWNGTAWVAGTAP